MYTYKIQMYVEGSEDDAISLRKSLAQTVYDEFELGSVFGVSVERDEVPEDLFDKVMALCMVELETGLGPKQILKLMDALPEGKKYMPIEFHANNTSAYGFVDDEYYQVHNYTSDFFEEQINAILDDKRLERPDGRYMTPDGRQFFMDYFKD